MFKIMKSANTWQFLRTSLPAPRLCRHHKCMFLFWLFKVWSVTCLNANEILNFMKIQSSYLLSNYQRNQASLYFPLFQLLFEQLFVKFMSVTMYAIDKILLLKCNYWNLFFTIFITYITLFYEQSIFDPCPEYCLSFSKKLLKKVVQQLLCRWSINCKHSKRRHSLFQGQIEYVMHTFELTSLKVCISLRFPMKKKGFSLYSQWIV